MRRIATGRSMVITLLCLLISASCATPAPAPPPWWQARLAEADQIIAGVNDPAWVSSISFEPVYGPTPLPSYFDLATVQLQVGTISYETQHTEFMALARTEFSPPDSPPWTLRVLRDRPTQEAFSADAAQRYDRLLRAVTTTPEEALAIARTALGDFPQQEVAVRMSLLAGDPMVAMFAQPVVWRIFLSTPDRQRADIVIDAQTGAVLQVDT